MVTERARKSLIEFRRVHQTEAERGIGNEAAWREVARCVKVNFDVPIDKENRYVGLSGIAQSEEGSLNGTQGWNISEMGSVVGGNEGSKFCN